MRNVSLCLLLLRMCLLLSACNGFVLHQCGIKGRQSIACNFPTFHAKASSTDETKMTDAEHEVALEKATKAMTAFTNKYLKNTDTKLCQDPSVAAVVIKGLAEHKVNLGAPLCPCRFYEDKEAEAKDGYWNCPCVPMRERHECHCMLFLTDENEFSGESQVSFAVSILMRIHLAWHVWCSLFCNVVFYIEHFVRRSDEIE
jgi:ferredoxin-thioredoxin reductase catalytic chain